MLKTYEEIMNNLKDKDNFVLLIDGYAGSGKTTLANKLAKELNASLIHIDDFYVPIDQREKDWFEKAGGNIDFKRINEEVVDTYVNKKPLIVNKFNPKIQKLEKIEIKQYNPRLILEGSYSMHPNIAFKNSYKVFLKCNEDKQKERLIVREKDNYINFKNIWIVKELNYQKEFNVETNSNMAIDTSNLF